MKFSMSVHTLNSLLHTTQYILYTTHCMLYPVQSTLYTVHSTTFKRSRAFEIKKDIKIRWLFQKLHNFTCPGVTWVLPLSMNITLPQEAPPPLLLHMPYIVLAHCEQSHNCGVFSLLHHLPANRSSHLGIHKQTNACWIKFSSLHPE